ncbi:MAG: hypothetical protein QOJ98_189 [Acidobacteriota bacterium]|jgi:hypothetical protein|nr:hypothetical protein [Acidobacteriota bacterium]
MKTRILILFIAMAAFAIPSFAQRYYLDEPIGGDAPGAYSGDYNYGVGAYLDNPCTAVQDWVYVNYSVYLEQEGVKVSGADRYLLAETMSLAGSYSAAGTSTADVTYTGMAFTTRQYHKVTSTYDNFHVVTVINVDPATQQTTVSLETACGNGLPDSPQ